MFGSLQNRQNASLLSSSILVLSFVCTMSDLSSFLRALLNTFLPNLCLSSSSFVVCRPARLLPPTRPSEEALDSGEARLSVWFGGGAEMERGESSRQLTPLSAPSVFCSWLNRPGRRRDSAKTHTDAADTPTDRLWPAGWLRLGWSIR